MEIVEDDLSSGPVLELLAQHLESMARVSPPECVHALTVDGLRAPDVTFWTAWENAQLLGCGALREIDTRHGEIKSMKTAPAHLRRGVAAALLQHLINESRARAYQRLSLETGFGPAFQAADALYRRFGFHYCGPFGDYPEHPFTRFMTLKLLGRDPS